VGKNLPTSQQEVVRVLLNETACEDAVLLEPGGNDRVNLFFEDSTRTPALTLASLVADAGVAVGQYRRQA
jgi:hypothetical protein